MDDDGNYAGGMDDISGKEFNASSGIPLTGYVYTEKNWPLSEIVIRINDDEKTTLTYKANKVTFRNTNNAQALSCKEELGDIDFGNQQQGAFGILVSGGKIKGLQDGIHTAEVTFNFGNNSGRETITIQFRTSPDGISEKNIANWMTEMGY